MVTQEELMRLVMSTPSVLTGTLVHLDLCGLIKLKNRLDPKLEECEIVRIETSQKQVNVEDWIDKWRNMFTELEPLGLSMGIGNRQVTIERMNLFLERVGSDVDLIFRATERYLNDCKERGRLAKLPQYFILPQGTGDIRKRNISTGDLYEWYSTPDNYTEHIGSYDA